MTELTVVVHPRIAGLEVRVAYHRSLGRWAQVVGADDPASAYVQVFNRDPHITSQELFTSAADMLADRGLL